MDLKGREMRAGGPRAWTPTGIPEVRENESAQEALDVRAKAVAAVGLADQVVALGHDPGAPQRLLGHPQRRRGVRSEQRAQAGERIVGLASLDHRAGEAA